MTGEAWVFLALAIAVGVLLAIALGGNAHIVAENRRLRARDARVVDLVDGWEHDFAADEDVRMGAVVEDLRTAMSGGRPVAPVVGGVA